MKYQCGAHRLGRKSRAGAAKEEIHDLLLEPGAPQPSIALREMPDSSMCVAGATEVDVDLEAGGAPSKAAVLDILQRGSMSRATSMTMMNARSSRSHAIFTVTLEQRGPAPPALVAGAAPDRDAAGAASAAEGGPDLSYLCAKMLLVDLAGSERVKRTGAVGARLQEGIHINQGAHPASIATGAVCLRPDMHAHCSAPVDCFRRCSKSGRGPLPPDKAASRCAGLLSLANVIQALVDGSRHVPYRNSKLTRLLQDSLGHNSRTVMVACVSPADANLEETINTLRYANRARSIKNKPVVNRDPSAAEILHLRQQLAAARAEVAVLRGHAAGDAGRPAHPSAVADLEARSRVASNLV
jgi:Kinesin motor domain